MDRFLNKKWDIATDAQEVRESEKKEKTLMGREDCESTYFRNTKDGDWRWIYLFEELEIQFYRLMLKISWNEYVSKDDVLEKMKKKKEIYN